MSDSNRDKIIAKIVALLAKTVANGATEAEAMSAAEKATELMALYQLEETELSVREDAQQYKFRRELFTGMYEPYVIWTIVAISRLTDTRAHYTEWFDNEWTKDRKGKVTFGKVLKRAVSFFGTDRDTEIAHYYARIVANALCAGADTYLANGGDGRSLKSYMLGMCSSMSSRLLGMVKLKNAPTTDKTGTGLIVLKNQLVDRAYAEEMATESLKKGKVHRAKVNEKAYTQGYNEGSKVLFNDAVSGTAKSNNLQIT